MNFLPIMGKSMSSYWEKYWNSILVNTDEQSQVGRTIKKRPISNDVFEKTVDWVAKKMQINKESIILDLCCGNGVWTVRFAKQVKHIIAVDFSEPLLNALKTELIKQKITNVDIKLEDVSAIKEAGYTYCTHIFWYFSIQHFSEKETIILFETAHNILRNMKGGIFYIGDIPDREKLWDFACTKGYAKMYFDSLKNNSPSIGSWFIKNDLIKLAEYAGFSRSEIIEQPSWQFNSKYRFDMKLEL